MFEIKITALIATGLLFSFTTKAQKTQDSIKTNKTLFINEIIVTGTRNETDVRNLPMTISIVSEKQLKDRQIQSVLPVLNEQVPGLFITSRGIMGYGVSTGAAGAMKLRGIGGNPTTGLLVLIDGEPQYMGLMGHPLADSYQTTIADRVEVIRGPASVLYGSNAMGGVINIVTSKLKKDTIQTNARISYGSYNTFESSVSNRIQKGRFNSKIAVSYNRTDGQRENMNFEQVSGQAKLGYNLNKEWNVNTNLTLSHFNASNPGTIAIPLIDNDSRITRGMSIFSVENNYSQTSGAVKAYYNWGNHFINDGYPAGAQPKDYRFHSRDNMSGVSLYQSATLLPNNRITVGVDYQHFGGNAWNKYMNNNQTPIVDTTLYELASYLDVRQTLGSLITIDAGMRYDYHSQTGVQWVPQLGLSVHLPKTIELKAMVSKGFRNPTIRELFMFPPQNPNLLPESVVNYELAFSQNAFNNKLSYNLSLFYIEGDNLIQTVFSNGRPLNVNTGGIKNHGFEAGLNYRINQHWAANANYSWLSMKYPVIAAPRHKAFLGIDYSNKNLSLSSGFQYINGLYTSIAPVKKENFLLWNLRTAYSLSKTVRFFVSAENLLNRKYEINAGYPMPGVTVSTGFNIQL